MNEIIWYAPAALVLVILALVLIVVAEGIYVALTTQMLPSPPDAPRGVFSETDGEIKMQAVKNSLLSDSPVKPSSDVPVRVLVIGDSVVEGTGLESTGHQSTIAPHFVRALGRFLLQLRKKVRKDALDALKQSDEEQKVDSDVRATCSTHLRIAWEAVGKAGATSESIYKRLRRRISAAIDRLGGDRIDLVVVSAGVNDVIRGRSPASYGTDMERLLRWVQDECPNAVVEVLGRPPLYQFPLLPFPMNFAVYWYAGLFFNQAKQVAAMLTEEAKGRELKMKDEYTCSDAPVDSPAGSNSSLTPIASKSPMHATTSSEEEEEKGKSKTPKWSQPKQGVYYIPCRHDVPLREGETREDIMAADGFHPNVPVLRCLAKDGIETVVPRERWERLMHEKHLA